MTTAALQHVEPSATDPIVPNPSTDAFNVVVVVPDQIPIRMVNATVLEDYEFQVFIASLFFGATTGFLAPTIQEFQSGGPLAVPFLMMTIVFAVAFVATLLVAMAKRKKLKAGGREIKLKTTGAIL
jgi:uncharacterized membrane protein